ncbi:hypothetical protein CDAR_571261 [Caerostris darwini]|uniref:Uncharacterized protein n=1 Tax=Caerostris darwini TaxID=1538125 RepID=A0AAV4SLS4_9ARAC|nr:hypothetical protein CDAR_571261 [Caerostris darwini]
MTPGIEGGGLPDDMLPSFHEMTSSPAQWLFLRYTDNENLVTLQRKQHPSWLVSARQGPPKRQIMKDWRPPLFWVMS